MKYEVGDKVLIRNDMHVSNVYCNCEFVLDMNVFSGSVATITETLPKSDQYRIDADNSKHFWHSNMFKLTTSQKFIKMIRL